MALALLRKPIPRNRAPRSFALRLIGLDSGMNKKILLIPAIGLFATTHAVAQDVGQEASAEAAEAAEEAVEDVEMTRPTSPALVIPPPAPPPPGDYARPASPTDWEAISPQQVDYPSASWVADEEGLVRYSVDIDAEGNPSDCVVVGSSGFPALDARTCEIVIERGTFEPAIDDDGNTIKSTFTEAHNWRKREPEFPGPVNVRVQFTIDESGETTDCEVLEISGVMSESMKRSFEREPCPGSRRNRGPYRDENGVPVAKQVTVAFEIMVEDAPG